MKRRIHAGHDGETIRVYQAYNHAIADAALAAQAFVAPFRFDRMTWIKPSLLWMMYRCGYARKDAGQARVLALDVRRAAFDRALDGACLSHFDPEVHASEGAWAAAKAGAHVVVQWDPDRDLRHGRLDRRAIQIGIGGPVVREFAQAWIARVEDVTPLALALGALVAAGDLAAAAGLLPAEPVYPATPLAAARLGIDP